MSSSPSGSVGGGGHKDFRGPRPHKGSRSGAAGGRSSTRLVSATPQHTLVSSVSSGGETPCCLRCGQKGHVRSACPQPQQPTSEGPTCYRCGHVGHFAVLCPQRTSAISGPSQSRGSTARGGHTGRGSRQMDSCAVSAAGSSAPVGKLNIITLQDVQASLPVVEGAFLMATNMKVDKPLQKENMEDQKHLKRKMEEEKAYAEFQNKVKRTILLDNLSPAVTSQIIKTSLAQCGNVLNVQFIPNYTIPDDIPQAALVEMETPKQALSLVDQIGNCPFMICGMPRPVRATLAKESNFADRPRRPGSNISYRWLKPGDADFEIAKKLKNLTKKHNTESAALLKHQLKEEASLATQHEDMLKTNWEKIETIERVTSNNGVNRLAGLYKVDLPGF